jgi:dimethylamine/trimethylamine dehydrogenase
MARDPRFDVLFEPVKIGPVTSPNRFYQVPHCTGMGHPLPKSLAAMREAKAEGGWGVVCTEYCSIHPSSDDTPYPYAALWDEEDVRGQALMTEAVHRHGSLAGVELWYGGMSTANRFSREISLSTQSLPLWHPDPGQTHAMDKADIRNFKQWHVDAALRAKRAGFDIVYVYVAHGYLPAQFLSRQYNNRTDEYGGSMENRARLMRELIEETKEAVGDTCGVAVRLAVDDLTGEYGITKENEGRDVIEMMAEMPDLWDVNIADFPSDAQTSRFVEEGAQESYIDFVKSLTTKPVVGVGRFTSADAMVGQINRGVLDMIGAARPSIADPFLPKKIEEGRIEDIRECIGCNLCISGDALGVPIRCTQNPTVGEEWRSDWHPETIAPKGSDDKVLIIGGGPSGLEAARALGQRGYDVHLAEATAELGGRINAETKLPGLAPWGRVRDYRVYQIQQMANVSVYYESRLDAAQVREFGAAHVVVATGSQWRADGGGRSNPMGVKIDGEVVVSPDDIMAGVEVPDPVVVFDDDHYYMAALTAEKLRAEGREVTLVTTAAVVSAWTEATLEQRFNQARIIEAGIGIVPLQNLVSFDGESVELACVYTDQRSHRTCDTVVLVTARNPDDALYRELIADASRLGTSSIKTVTAIGDCYAPSTIAAAVYAGHQYARELDAPVPDGIVRNRRERALV